MIKKTSSVRNTYYRRCRIHPVSTQNLQQLISTAINEKKLIKDRLETVDSGANLFRVIADSRIISGMQCGTLLTFERGGYQLVVDDDPDASSLIMAAVEPPKNGEKQQQFVPGALFFAIFENHIVLAQSAALRATALEQHFAWLLRTQTKLLSTNQGIALVDEPQKATVERIRHSHVKSLSIGRPFMVNSTLDQKDDSTTEISSLKKSSNVSMLKPNPDILNMLKSFLPEDKFSKLNLEDEVFEGNLEVWMAICYPSRSRVHPADTVKLIDDIALALRDQEEDSIELELGDGTKVKGSDLKIVGSATMQLLAGTPQLEEFYQDLTEWLRLLLKNNVVST